MTDIGINSRNLKYLASRSWEHILSALDNEFNHGNTKIETFSDMSGGAFSILGHPNLFWVVTVYDLIGSTLYKLYAVPVRVCSTHEDMHYP